MLRLVGAAAAGNEAHSRECLGCHLRHPARPLMHAHAHTHTCALGPLPRHARTLAAAAAGTPAVRRGPAWGAGGAVAAARPPTPQAGRPLARAPAPAAAAPTPPAPPQPVWAGREAATNEARVRVHSAAGHAACRTASGASMSSAHDARVLPGTTRGRRHTNLPALDGGYGHAVAL